MCHPEPVEGLKVNTLRQAQCDRLSFLGSM